MQNILYIIDFTYNILTTDLLVKQNKMCFLKIFTWMRKERVMQRKIFFKLKLCIVLNLPLDWWAGRRQRWSWMTVVYMHMQHIPALWGIKMPLGMTTLSSEFLAQSTIPFRPFMGKLISVITDTAGSLWMLATRENFKDHKFTNDSKFAIND